MRLPILLLLLFSLPLAVFAENRIKHIIAEDLDEIREVQAFDIDGDGDMDIAGVARGLNMVAWWENEEGVFTQHIISEQFWDAWSIAVADIDFDGDGDIFTAGYFADEIAMWEYNPSVPGGWDYHQVIHINGSKGVTLVDMNRDGRLDVIGAGAKADKIIVAMNLGYNSWGLVTVVEGLEGARQTYAADLNGDDRLDIIASAGASGTIVWLEWDEGNWIEHEIIGEEYKGSRGVHAADIDNDGDLDVVSAARYINEVTWWENRNNGESWVRHPIPYTIKQPRNVLPTDVDEDGDIDIVANGFQDDAVVWFENLGNNEWGRRFIVQGFDGALGFDLRDMDGDNDMDIVVAGNSADQVGLWETISADPVQVNIRPHEPTQVFSSEGGSIMYDVTMRGEFSFATDVEWWTELIAPNGTLIDTSEVLPCTFMPGETITITDQTIELTDVSKEGEYKLSVKVGKYPDAVQEAGSVNVPVARSIRLRPAYPNPFNAIAQIELVVPSAGDARVMLYNVLGQQVAVLHRGPLQAGVQTFVIDGDNLASGVYFIRAEVGKHSAIRKITLIQ
ncbi:T9SS type A sorting domain-containing protein [bacterium]|nr:T9SS type A sorting domain-containing protein [bacterium]